MYTTNTQSLWTYSLLQITTARAGYGVETQLLSYSNPEHRLANGSCCTESCRPCQVQFRICRRNHGTRVESSGCPSGVAVDESRKPVMEAENGSIIFNPNGELHDKAFITNPLTYIGISWGVSICRNCYEIPAGASPSR